MAHTYRLYSSERRRIHHALHSISLDQGSVLWTSRVPGFYDRAKELADQTWANQSEWEPMQIVLDDYDVFVFHQACLRPADRLHEAAEWAREVFDPPHPDAGINFYGAGWSEARQAALEQANHVCERCELSQQEHRNEWSVGLHVHHQTPVRQFESPMDAHHQDNLKVLCVDCHSRAHSES